MNEHEVHGAEILRKSYAADGESVRRVRLDVAAIAGSLECSDEVLGDLKLAVSEAASNVVRHAYDEGRGEIHVTVALPDERVLAVIVADDGDWLAGPRDAWGIGLGLFLMRECSDALRVERTQSGGVGVHMRFLLQGSRRQPRALARHALAARLARMPDAPTRRPGARPER
jgi:serine/threonine-protein kinase RsbW